MNKFIVSSSTRETSQEIINAIWSISNKTDIDAERIWCEPTSDELRSIWETVTKNGLLPAATYCWGASGYQWGENL